jgi:hypothetical protein
MDEHQIKIHLYRAPDDPHTSLVYMEGHKSVLANFEIEMITSNNSDWVYDDGIYVIVAESMKNGDMIGGIRVQLKNNNNLLPIEVATKEMDSKIFDIVKSEANRGVTGEICALWTSRKHKGIGIGNLLISISTAILNQLGVTALFGLCDARNVETMRMFGGYDIETSVGNNGSFYYPKLDLVAYALRLKDPDNVKLASASVQEMIVDLRKNPIQEKKIIFNKRTLTINYNLLKQN